MVHAFSCEEYCFPLAGGVELDITIEQDLERGTLCVLPEEDAGAHGEERVQLLEGCSYEYDLPKGYSLKKINGIVRPSRKYKHRGRICPGIYVGRLALSVESDSGETTELAVEVRSIKVGYRNEYRGMLEDITGACTELLMLHSSPVTQSFSPDYESDSETLYQRFAFVKSIVDSNDFRNAVHRVTAMPVTAWKERMEERDIRRSRRIDPSQLRQIASRSDRILLPVGHPLQARPGITSVPARLSGRIKSETVDTPENRFVKHALEEFRRFCALVCRHIDDKATPSKPKRPAIHGEARYLEEKLAGYLSHNIFYEVSRPHSLPLNSPVLQRKEGYREILRVWLMFDLAAKLTWDALENDEYQAGKRDVATLYEYWLFFKLLGLVQEIFHIEARETKDLIKETKDGLGLQLKGGRHIAISGKYEHMNRKLQVEYSYNRSFDHSDYPSGGSWTQSMRPDYTLSLWPIDFSKEEAEQQELIVHIHFDAKYKVEGLQYLLGDEKINPDTEKLDQKEGKYKRADLLKMHAYKDAIRRTAGAYVLYPGSKKLNRRGFHEIIPGLGAFPVSPSNCDEGLDKLRRFIVDVVDHLADRASRREELSFHTYQTQSSERKKSPLREAMPEYVTGKGGSTEKLRVVPAYQTTVLIGYYRKKQYQWIEQQGLYNIRVDKESGLNALGPEETGVKYLLLHGRGELITGKLWKTGGDKPVLMSAEELKLKGYPSKPSQEYYLVYSVSKVESDILSDKVWDVKKLNGFKTGRQSARPFVVKLQEFMNAVARP